MKRFAVAGGVVFLCVALCAAEDFRCVITKVDGSKITYHKLTGGGKGKKAEKGEAITTEASSSVKVVKSKFNADTKKAEDGDALEGGLKNEAFSKGEVNATISVEDGKITKIRVGGGRKKKDAAE